MPIHAGVFGQGDRIDYAEQQENKRRGKIDTIHDVGKIVFQTWSVGFDIHEQRNQNRMDQGQDAEGQYAPAYVPMGQIVTRINVAIPSAAIAKNSAGMIMSNVSFVVMFQVSTAE